MFGFIRLVCLSALCFITTLTGVMAANPLGLQVGKAHYKEVNEKLSSVVNLKNQGINKYSGGKMVVADNPELLGYDGLQKVTLIFDKTDILTAVIMRLDRNNDDRRDSGFMYAYKRLSEKYLPVFRNLKSTGRMSAGFVTPAKDVHIRMIAPEASQNFDLQYLSDNFWQNYENSKKLSTTANQSAQYTPKNKPSLF